METDLPGRFRADAHKGDYRMALYEHTVMTRQDLSLIHISEPTRRS